MPRRSQTSNILQSDAGPSIVKTAQYILTAPWQNLHVATQQMIEIDGKEAQEKSIRCWTKDKRAEYKYVSLAGTIVASAVTGSIQWTQTSAAHWTVLAAWYGSLLLSLFCIVVAFQLNILVATYDSREDVVEKLLRMVRHEKHAARPSTMALFTLQVPMMLLSYSIMSYIVGLGVLVLRALWTEPWGSDRNIAVFFLVVLVLAIGIYIFVCFVIYHEFLPDLAQRMPREDDD